MTGARTANEAAPPAGSVILDWEGALNARDVGGLPAEGGRIRPGALVRSDVLSRLTPSGRAALLAHGVRTIVDVRAADEVAADAHVYPFRPADAADRAAAGAGAGVDYRNVPFHLPRDDAAWTELRAAYAAAASREELNRLDLDVNAAGVARVVAAIADAGPGGVLVHCHAGKDRTGTIVALLLSLAGVPDEAIADDYAMTALNLDALIADWLDEMSQDPDERVRLRALAEPRREAMLDTLQYLRRGYGSAERYLLGAGLSEAQVARLRQRLVEPA